MRNTEETKRTVWKESHTVDLRTGSACSPSQEWRCWGLFRQNKVTSYFFLASWTVLCWFVLTVLCMSLHSAELCACLIRP